MAEAISTTINEIQQENLQSCRLMHGDARDRMKELPANSVDLIVTSPPYGSIKQYTDDEREIGFNQKYDEYHESLMEVFRECVRVLHSGCRMVINIGDEFVSTTKKRPYHIRPNAAQLISNIINEFPDTMIYTGTIHWQKVSTSNTSGGGKIMGSVYHPRNGHFFVNYEHVIVFKKLGKDRRPSKEDKAASKFTLEERREWFKDTWHISPEIQDDHIAMFPFEIPERLIRMYSFVGETVLDPFAGSGTTLAAASAFDRSSIGIELGFDEDWKEIIEDKIQRYNPNQLVEFV